MEDDSRLIELFRLGDSNVSEQLAREIKRKNNYQTLHTLLDETISRSTLLTSKIIALENERLEGQLRILRLITQFKDPMSIKILCPHQQITTDAILLRKTFTLPILHGSKPIRPSPSNTLTLSLSHDRYVHYINKTHFLHLPIHYL